MPDERFDSARQTQTLVVLAGRAVWLAALGWVDRATGYELGLFAFCTAPVGMVAWHLGRGPGIAAAFIASVVWHLTDRLSGNRYSIAFYGYWNSGMHFGTFMINAVAIAKIKSSLNAGPLQGRAEECLASLPPECREAALCDACRQG